MSDWGHAMLSNDRDRVEHYGKTCYIYDGANATHISTLYDLIVAAWQNDCENGFTGDFGGQCDENYWSSIDADEIYNSFNPNDIVDSAEAWDSELVMWIWNRILEPNNIDAVITQDGAIVFDANLLVKEDE